MRTRLPLRALFKPFANVLVFSSLITGVCLCIPAQAKQTTRLDAARSAVDAGLAQYRSTHAQSVLLSTIYTMSGALDIGELTPSNFVPARRALVQSWARIIAVTEASYDQTFNPQDPANIPENCEIPPREGNVQLPSCADPKDVKDPRARAVYEAEIAKNNEVTKRWNTYQQMTHIDRLATTSLRAELDLLRKIQPDGTSPDFAALDDIVRRAGVSDARRRVIDTFFYARARP